MINNVTQPSFRGLSTNKAGEITTTGKDFDLALLSCIENRIPQAKLGNDNSIIVNFLNHIQCKVNAIIDKNTQTAQLTLTDIKYKDTSEGDCFEISNLSPKDKERTNLHKCNAELLYNVASQIVDQIKRLQVSKIEA